MYTQMQVGLRVQCSLFLSHFNHNWNESTNVNKFQIPNIIKLLWWFVMGYMHRER